MGCGLHPSSVSFLAPLLSARTNCPWWTRLYFKHVSSDENAARLLGLQELLSMSLLSPYFLKDILSFCSLKFSPSFPCSYPLNRCVGLILNFHSWLFSPCPPNQRNMGWPIVPPSIPDGPSGKEPACQCRRYERCSSIPGLGRSPGEGNGNPLQYSCLENPMDRGAWWAIVHGVTKSQT